MVATRATLASKRYSSVSSPKSPKHLINKDDRKSVVRKSTPTKGKGQQSRGHSLNFKKGEKEKINKEEQKLNVKKVQVGIRRNERGRTQNKTASSSKRRTPSPNKRRVLKRGASPSGGSTSRAKKGKLDSREQKKDLSKIVPIKGTSKMQLQKGLASPATQSLHNRLRPTLSSASQKKSSSTASVSTNASLPSYKKEKEQNKNVHGYENSMNAPTTSSSRRLNVSMSSSSLPSSSYRRGNAQQKPSGGWFGWIFRLFGRR